MLVNNCVRGTDTMQTAQTSKSLKQFEVPHYSIISFLDRYKPSRVSLSTHSLLHLLCIYNTTDHCQADCCMYGAMQKKHPIKIYIILKICTPFFSPHSVPKWVPRRYNPFCFRVKATIERRSMNVLTKIFLQFSPILCWIVHDSGPFIAKLYSH